MCEWPRLKAHHAVGSLYVFSKGTHASSLVRRADAQRVSPEVRSCRIVKRSIAPLTFVRARPDAPASLALPDKFATQARARRGHRRQGAARSHDLGVDDDGHRREFAGGIGLERWRGNERRRGWVEARCPPRRLDVRLPIARSALTRLGRRVFGDARACRARATSKGLGDFASVVERVDIRSAFRRTDPPSSTRTIRTQSGRERAVRLDA